ncbi:MAG: cysteine--tRNA ligase [Alphaproteobacteria bacterium]|jgi:cysteinyl-tRNA synthetase|nr:cysteine--tRNA ligase [Alphaproteobacteria bacterium]
MAHVTPKIHLYHSRTKKVEPFTPREPGKVGMYVCGPTVYDRAHLGNARPVVVFDVLFRLLQTQFEVTYVRNITDIDDKIMGAARTQNRPIEDITKETTRYFHEEMEALKALPPTFEPRATQYVDQMISFIEALISKNHAYAAKGHVLFDVPSLPSYGSLSHCHQEEMLAGARVEVAPYKRNPADFVLWKPSNDDQPGWESPWGRGRPGWHIECSAMSLALLGTHFDLHGGGQDLLFPHHENECAQSTALNGTDSFAQHWLHNGILTVNGEKMSKSLGNFVTVQELLTKASGETVRLALLSTHYRQALDWSEATMTQAKAVLTRLYTALKGFDPQRATKAKIDPAFLQALCEDLNTPKALTRLHELSSAIHKAVDEKEKQALQGTLKKSADLLGLLGQDYQSWSQNLPAGLTLEIIEALIQERIDAKKRKDFAKADAIRCRLEGDGILLEDGVGGTTWRRST